MPILTLPKSIRERLGEEATDAFIEFFKEFEKEIKNDLATKKDIKEIELRIKEVEANMEVKLAQFKVEIIKWVAGFLIAQTGILIRVLKFL